MATPNPKAALITGAGSGIGAAAARLFHDRGWYVGLYDLNADSVATLAGELGDRCCHGFMDVTDSESVAAAIGQFSEHRDGRLDVLINNAGLFQDKLFVQADEVFLREMMHVNMDGVINCARAAYPLLKATPNAHMVNIGSSSSIYGVPFCAVYSATKFFVRGFTEAMRLEWEQDDITVNVVMPSYVSTPMTVDVQLSHINGASMLSVEQIALAVWKAATTRGMYWIMPRSNRLIYTVMRKMPLQWVPRFAKTLFKAG